MRISDWSSDVCSSDLLESIGGRGGGHADLPVGLGLRDGDEAGMAGGVRWVEPNDAKPADGRNGSRATGGGTSFPTSFGPAQSTLETTEKTVANADARAAGGKSAQPVYTVPNNRSEERRVGTGGGSTG